MRLPESPHPPAPTTRRRRAWLWITAIILIGFVVGSAWQRRTLHRAEGHLRAAGFTTHSFTSTIDEVSKNPRLLFRQSFWRNVRNWRGQQMSLGWSKSARTVHLQNLDVFASSIRRVRPQFLGFDYCDSLQNVDGLKGARGVTGLSLRGCPVLRNLDGIDGMKDLQSLTVEGCDSLQDIRGLKDLTGLQRLRIDGCRTLQNVDDLKNLTSLRSLVLLNCTALQNVDGLKGLTGLQEINLNGCHALQNVDGLKGLTGLRSLFLIDCLKLSDAAVRDLRAALPSTKILFRGLSDSPP